jgi:hypothetical protein
MGSRETKTYFIFCKKRLDIRYSYYFLLKKAVFFNGSSSLPGRNFPEKGESVLGEGFGSQEVIGWREISYSRNRAFLR